jgi:hypothetical protein
LIVALIYMMEHRAPTSPHGDENTSAARAHTVTRNP